LVGPRPIWLKKDALHNCAALVIEVPAANPITVE
jgi:hypothetical protein